LTLNQNGDISTVKEYSKKKIIFKENNDNFLCYIKKTLVVGGCSLWPTRGLFSPGP